MQLLCVVPRGNLFQTELSDDPFRGIHITCVGPSSASCWGLCWFRTSRTDASSHGGRMSQGIPDMRGAGSGDVHSPPVITAVTVEKGPVDEVAATCGTSRSWLYELLARHRDEGEQAFTARSRAPRTSPAATSPATVDLLLNLRNNLAAADLDADADTLQLHSRHYHD